MEVRTERCCKLLMGSKVIINLLQKLDGTGVKCRSTVPMPSINTSGKSPSKIMKYGWWNQRKLGDYSFSLAGIHKLTIDRCWRKRNWELGIVRTAPLACLHRLVVDVHFISRIWCDQEKEVEALSHKRALVVVKSNVGSLWRCCLY